MFYKKKIIIILSSVILLWAVVWGFFTIKNIKQTPINNIPTTNSIEKIAETSDSKVISFFPIWSIDNLDQTILVSFSKTMVPLKILDQEADCPLDISPITLGKCRWISTQTVEFTPEQWKPATKYTVSIKWSGQNYSWSFTTPLLKRAIWQNQSLSEWIRLIFNFPVNIEQLKKYLSIKNANNNEAITVDIVEDTTQWIYILKPQKWLWNYLSTYNFSLTNPLDSQEWNLPSKLENLSYTTSDSILNVETLQYINNTDNSWFEYTYYNDWIDNSSNISSYNYDNFYEIYNTKASTSRLLQNKNIVLDVYFAEAINQLSPEIIRFSKDNVAVSYSLSYVPETIRDEVNRKSQQTLTKKKIRITIKDTLNIDSTYTLAYVPDGKNIISTRTYKTAPNLKVTRIVPVSYSKVCVYTNNTLDLSQQIFSSIPESRVQSTSQQENFYDMAWFENLNIKKSELDNFLTKNNLCPAPKQDESVYIINTRLNPSSKYQLKITPQDIYWNKIAPIEKSFTTEKIKDKDKFLYIWHPYKNTIPDNVPLVINVQSINTDKASLEVCTMNIEDYLNNVYMGFAYEEQNSQINIDSWSQDKAKNWCSQFVSKDISIQNRNRGLSNTRIDLENDILWSKANKNIIRISWKLITNDPIAKTRNFSSIFVKSNISLMLENGINKTILLATTFDGQPIPGLNFVWYSRNENGIGFTKVPIKATYNEKKWTYELNTIASVIVASKWNYRWMTDTMTDIWENYDFGYIAWQDSSEKEFLYLYTERPIYKPGDKVYFKWLLRTFNFDWFKQSKSESWTLSITNEQGNELMRVSVGVDKNSNFDGSFVLSKEMDLWSYFIKYIKKDQSEIQTNTTFFVEEYQKPVFKIDIDSWTNDTIVWENINISINPSYYFGGKITNTAGRYNILAQKYYFNAKDYSDFQFGEWNGYISCIYRDECDYIDRSINLEDSNFTVDKNWNYKLSYKINDTESESLYSFIFEVKDPTTQKPVSKTVNKVIHATDWYVGIQLPYRNTNKQWIKLNAVTLDRNAQAKPNSSITIKLVKQDRKAVKKQWIDWVFYNDYSLEEKEELSEKTSTDDKWNLEKILMPKSDWEYKVIVSYLWKSWVPFVSSQIVYVSGNDPLLRRTENNSITKVVAEKTMVNVWDNAQYTIQSPINTWIIFIAIEKDDGILDYFTMPLKDYATKLILPIKKEYYPNIYIKAFLIGSQKDNPLPIYKRWLAISKVNTLGQKLNVKITTDKEIYAPWEKPAIQVLVSDDKNNPVANANLSIGIVDQSLLALKGNPIKNPFAYFYDMKRYLWTLTSLSLKTLVEKLEIKDTSNWSKWWDGGSMKWWNSKKKRWIFKDTAYRNANITTDSKWIATITADALPDNLTTRVIESLVNTPDTKVWVSTKNIQTTLALLINPNLPNMISIDDKVILHPVVFNKTDKEQSVSFSISGTYLNIKNAEQKIKIPAQSQIPLDFDVEVVGKNIAYDTKLASKIIMSATTDNKDIRDDVQIWIPIIQNATKETVTTVWNISGSIAQEALDIPQDIQWSISLTYSKSLFGSLLDGINMSLFGTYDCLEQRFSSFMPHIYTKQLYTSANKWSDYNFNKIFIKQWSDWFDWYQDISLDNYIKQQLISMENFQNPDWWFVFRNDSAYKQQSSVRLTNYILSSMSNLRDLWYTIPKDIASLATKYLKTQFYKEQKNCTNISNQSCIIRAKQAMITISSIADRDIKDKELLTMWELIAPLTKDNKDTSDMLYKAILLWKLSQQNISYKNEIAPIISTVLNEQLVMEPKTAHIGKNTTYNNITDTAYLLEASSYIPELTNKYSTIYDALQRWIWQQKQDGSRWSTQDTVNVIRSLTRFISVNPISKDKINIDTLIWKKQLTQISLAQDEPFITQKIDTSLEDINHKSDINIKSDSKSKSYYDITMSYFIPAKDIQARYQWFVVKKDYYKYEDYMDISNKKSAERNDYLQGKITYKSLKYPKNITTYLQPESSPKIWEVLVTNMTIITSEPREQVAIENFIPAGAELINPHLMTESKYAAQTNNNINDAYGYGSTQDMWDYNDWSNLVPEQIVKSFECDKEEFRTEKYFCYRENLEPWVYTVTSLIRITHAGTFAVRPTMVFEFYNPENFGRTIGTEIIVTK